MPRLMLCLLVAALPFAAAAQTADPNATGSTAANPEAVDPDAPMEVTAAQEDAAAAETDKKKALDHFCLQNTGSLITARNATASRRCAGIGRSYSQDEIRRTGETNIADALRRLDASIY